MASFSVEIVNWYNVLTVKTLTAFNPSWTYEEALKTAEFWSPLVSSTFIVILVVMTGYMTGLSKLNPSLMSDEQLMPPKRFGVLAFLELCWSIVQSTLESTIGEKQWLRFLPVLGSTFFFLVFINISGVLPGFEPATASMNFTFAAAILIFVYFNYYGFKESGFSYVKHLAGPVIWIAPLMFFIELVSLLARPVSLSLRIFGNIFGDHFVFSIFSGLMTSISAPFLPIPAIFLGFGTFVAVVQAFIFMTLSAVYIKLALDSKEEHH